MPKIGNYFTIEPEKWLFETHGDVIEAKRRAQAYLEHKGNYEGVEFYIEEFVRQWVLYQLINCYNYPKEWIGERLIIEEPVKMGSTEKEADISLKNSTRRTFIYIEVKKRGISEEIFNEAERQLETYLSSTHTATIGLVTDGDKVRAIRKKIDPNDFEYIPDIYAYGGSQASQVKLVREIPESGDKTKTGLTPINADYEKILFDCHSIVRDIDGLHADEALDELSKVLYVKIYDEKTTIKKGDKAEFRFQIYGASNPSEVASNIRVLYEEARDKELEIFSKRIPNYERSRGVFKTQIRLSDPALYSVVEKLQKYSLVDTATDIKGRAFQGVLSSAIRAGMGQYFTPDPIVEIAVGILQPTPNDMILDPFCGSGHFLTSSLDYVVKNYGDRIKEADLYEFKFFHLHGIEKSERMVRIAMTDMMLHDDGHSNIRNLDALLSFENYPDILALRDDGESDPAVFSLILTNPPFGSIMRGEVKEMIGRFSLGDKKKSLPLEILGLERSFQFLKPGGRMAIVLPDGLLKNKNAKFVRKWVEQVAEIKAIISLPEESFNAYGAMVKTSLCIFRKLENNEVPNPNSTALLVEVENLGYDATGRSKTGSEVQDIIDLFHKEIGWK
ncbi:N-6 DNA methylase [Bacteroides fragilis]|uniref:Restriction endonuclease subunit M n=1 Tax=Bacteroides fragilis TaxID=817 RepID=A0AAP8ZXW0_BACFG|nr:N-6 DNA methylase [Bacteroides fragilis]MBV4154146.1 N-6 DNA methylase [Bacteroides fragilis]MCE8580788.1 N-6 DNA methylase [Bacteroides fragilis]MCE8650544.1 N-6 DNA methylase [Bacteroides fragilis]MCS2596726.1 N-6 DNA methylase [Bacteroides fragilis]MCS3146691.1 N-6 DNA methylase [Bacteroides fragilis]